MATYIECREIVFLLTNGEWAFPVKVDSRKTKNVSFRSAPMSANVLGTDWDTEEVEVSEAKMIDDVLIGVFQVSCRLKLNFMPPAFLLFSQGLNLLHLSLTSLVTSLTNGLGYSI